MELIWAALVASGLTLLGGVVIQLLIQRGDERRRAHELTLRRLDHAHDHRERLFDRRVEAYRAFGTTFLEHRRKHEELGTSWGHVYDLARKLRAAEENLKAAEAPDLTVLEKRFDAAEVKFKGALEASNNAVRNVDDALIVVEAVASTPVLEAARSVAKAAEDAWTVRQELAELTGIAGPDDWARLQAANDKVERARQTLRDAMSKELQLDREDDATGF